MKRKLPTMKELREKNVAAADNKKQVQLTFKKTVFKKN